jgi:V8-like Glu-specific endopeptidase
VKKVTTQDAFSYESVGNDTIHLSLINRITGNKKQTIQFKNNSSVLLGKGTPVDLTGFSHISSIYSIKKNQGMLPKVIVDSDDRMEASVKNYPYEIICLLLIFDEAGNKYYGTGFFISERCVITAGHCVYFKNKWAGHIDVIPGATSRMTYGGESSKRFQSVKGWTINKDRNFDYGAIILPDNTLYNRLNSGLAYEPFGEDKKDVEISGYPDDKNGMQWKCKGKVSYSRGNLIYYDVDTINGNSGSPKVILHVPSGLDYSHPDWLRSVTLSVAEA